MKPINLKITIAADNHIPAFAGFVNYFDKSRQNEPRIVVSFNAMFGAMVTDDEEDFGCTFKEFFAENVVHEMLHMVQQIFEQAFDEEEVENAILQCRKKWKEEQELLKESQS